MIMLKSAPSGILSSRIAATGAQMRAKLEEIRSTYNAPVNKGNQAESIVRSFLRSYLPRNMDVGHGEVIDTHGNSSSQTDVVITALDHPFTFTADEAGLFFIEGLLAVGEVKTRITATELEDGIRKSKRFKRLKARPPVGFRVSTGQDRFRTSLPFFVFSFESELSLESIKLQLEEAAARTSSVTTEEMVDAVFVLDRGFLINLGDGNEAFQAVLDDGGLAQGWHIDKENDPLFYLLGWLSVVMPQTLSIRSILADYLIPATESSETSSET